MVPDPDVCGVCGGPKAVCQDHDAQNAWVVAAIPCYRTQAVQAWQQRRKDDPNAGTYHLTAHIDDTRRKSAGGR